MDPNMLVSKPQKLFVDIGRGWEDAGTRVEFVEPRSNAGVAQVMVRVPESPVRGVRLRWQQRIDGPLRILGDHWERGYGDLEWRGLVPERMLPWYVLVQSRDGLQAAGVLTGCAALAYWQIDSGGVTLTLDTRSGGAGVQLGARALLAAEIAVRRGRGHEDAQLAAHQFCKQLCCAPRLPKQPVYGVNDWYYAYGHNTADGILGDADRLAAWTTGLANRPALVIDDGWMRGAERLHHVVAAEQWLPNGNFGDMARVGREIAARGIVPGIWIRPLAAAADTLASQRLHRPGSGHPRQPVLDPSIPEGLEAVRRLVRQVCDWGFRVIKHDYTTFEIAGRWGFEMRDGFTCDGWTFADSSRTTAEIIRDLYATIREAAGDAVVIGCNTVGHLGAGLFELQRTGDDTSGQNWERTRKMGPNTLAMRMPQHEAFFVADADCVGLTTKIPWQLNRQWLDVLARSGTALFVSPAKEAVGPEQAAALRVAFAVAAVPRRASLALDWQDCTAPVAWRHADGASRYDWDAETGNPPVVP